MKLNPILWLCVSVCFFVSVHQSVAAPNISVNPDTISRNVTVGGYVNVPLSISNSGDQELVYFSPSEKRTSDESGGPVYEWTDISTTGSVITGLGDEGRSGTLNLGFGFPFYGQSFSSILVSANGYVTFSSAIPSTSWTNLSLPNSGAVASMIAFLWDDLYVTQGGAVHYQVVDAETFVLQFTDVPRYGDYNNRVTCQLVLKASGQILMHYKRVDMATSCTVGVQDHTRTRAVQAVFDATLLKPNFTIAIHPESSAAWLQKSANLTAGTLAEGSSVQGNVTLNAQGLLPGTHQTTVILSSNAPNAPTLSIPVSFEVESLLSHWKPAYFTASELQNDLISGDTSDPDGDGIPNFMEFALNGDPKISEQGNMPYADTILNPANGNRHLTLTFERECSAFGITFIPEVSGNLTLWNNGPDYTEEVAVQNHGDGSETVVVKDKTPMSTSVQRYMRLKVVSQPSGTPHGTVIPRPPKMPGALVAKALSGNKVTMSWADGSSNESSFQVEMKYDYSWSNYWLAATVAANTTYFEISNLYADYTYRFRVRAIGSGGASAFSNEATATVVASAPPVPTGLVAAPASASQINLSWVDASSSETAFILERRQSGTPDFVEIARPAANVKTYQNTGLTAGTKYYYRVAATNSVGTSEFSVIADATTYPPPPQPPSNLTGNAASAYAINLAWSDNSAAELGFKIERKTGAAGTYAVVANVNANVVSLLTQTVSPATTYFFRITAYSMGGASPYSNEVGVTTPAGSSLRPVPNTQRSVATNLTLITSHAYEVGGYGASYNPVVRHGEFAVADWSPCVLDCGQQFYGNVWDRTVDYRKVGFSHGTYRSTWSGSEYVGPQFWNTAPWSAKAALAYLDGPFFNAGSSTPRYHLDPTGAIGDPKTPNFWRGLEQMPQIRARIDTMAGDLWDHSLYAYDYEASDYMPNNPGNTRNTLEGGKYRHESQGGTDPYWKTKTDTEYWVQMTEAGSSYWKQFDAHFRSKMRPGSQFFQYGNGCAATLGGGRPSGYGPPEIGEHHQQTTNSGTGLSLWWYTWTQKFWHSDHKDFTSGCDQYYNQTTARGSRALTDLMWTYEIQHRGMITEMGIRGAGATRKPSLVFIAPFMERNPRQGWRQEHEPATVQVARGMAIIPWFYKGGGWLWGTEAHPTWGQEITGINGVSAKGEGTDHYIAGRKMLAPLAAFKQETTEVVCVEVSFDGGATWMGDSTNFMEGTRSQNLSKYNAYFIHDRTKDGGTDPGRGWPAVFGLRAANGKVALAASRVGGLEEDNVSFKARIKRPDNSYWQADITLHDREWIVGYEP